MPESYVSRKIKEALESTAGDKRDAQKLMITWAVRDPVLLLGLTKPHLKGIVAAQIEHESSAMSKTKAAATKDSFSEKQIKEMIASPRPLGEKRSTLPPPKSSRRQASVMQQIADAFRKGK